MKDKLELLFHNSSSRLVSIKLALQGDPPSLRF